MNVGVLTLELAVYEAQSLKDKRRVVKSVKERVRNRFNVSIAEVDHLESRRLATLAVAMVSNDSKYIHGSFERIVDLVRRTAPASLLDFDKELL